MQQASSAAVRSEETKVRNLLLRNLTAGLLSFGATVAIDFLYITGILGPLTFVLLPLMLGFVLLVPFAFLRANETPELPAGDPRDVALNRMLIALTVFVFVVAIPLFEIHFLMGGRS